MKITILNGGHRSIELPLSDEELNFQMRQMGIRETIPKGKLVKVSEKDNPLQKLEGQFLNMDEVNFFARRMEHLTEYERKVLEAYANNCGVSTMKDLINLTFSMKGLSLLTDFSDASQVGVRLYMQYIWEVVLAAEKNGIREADLQYEVPEVRSPYLEVSFYDLNTQTVEQTAVEVNPFYRFFDIFSGVLDINQKEYEKTKEIFVDAVFHYLALTDLRMGMSRKDYYFKFLVEELESGQFGRKAKAAIQLFSSYEKKYIVLALMDVVSSRNYREIFKWLFQEIYKDSIIYKSMDCANELYIYVGSAETQEERKRVQFLLDTFLPIGVRTEVFYLEHFGILEIEETMILDKILLI